MTVARRRAGEPLLALGLVVVGWVALRTMALSGHDVPPYGSLRAEPGARPVADASQPVAKTTRATAAEVLAPPTFVAPPPAVRFTPAQNTVPRHVFDQSRLIPQPAFAPVPATVASSHLMLWIAAMSRVQLPPELAAVVFPAGVPPVLPASDKPRERRWSGDAWLLARKGNGGPQAASLFGPTYGGSQAGAVLRYRLAPPSAHLPTAYARATAALGRSGEREIAVGLSARPLAGLPVRVAAELRATDHRLGTRIRPAVAAISELPAVDLPLRFRAEVYGQAGYVGGSGATAFADGQFRLDRPLSRLGNAEIRAGGGVWGGAQKGAARLDVGPSAVLGGLSFGATGTARLTVDWRLRVAGNAEPASGPALTLSAGF